MGFSGQGGLVFGVILFVSASVYEVISDTTCNLDIEKTLETLLDPSTDPSIQIKALRSSLLRQLQAVLAMLEAEEEERRRHLAAISGWNSLPESKRNLESLARAGYIKTLPDNEEDEDSNYKRSIADLAKNGQRPMLRADQKRGIETLARNGDYHMRGERLNDPTMTMMLSKKNLGSLARNFNLPPSGKRSLSSLARAGDLRYKEMGPKRNLVALVRDGFYPGFRYDRTSYPTEHPEISSEKRNSQGSTNSRNKRQVDYENEEYPAQPYHDLYDYDDMIQDFYSAYPVSEKRFLGSVAKTGWFRQTPKYPKISTEKRHIGALARLGWLSPFKQTRGFNRSGRSASLDEICRREATSNGETEVYTSTKNQPLSLIQRSNSYRPQNPTYFFRKVFY